MNEADIRAWRFHRQGLDGSLKGASPSEVLKRSGWARSVGGCSPYLALYARGGLSREAVDRAVEAGEIGELPSARGCMYVLPREDFGLGLQCGSHCGFPAEMRTARKLGVSDEEVDELARAVEAALDGETLPPDQLRKKVNPRSLGPEGQKKGITSTLPLALGKLEQEGRIRRQSTNGRLDNQRFAYRAWRPGPLAQGLMEPEEVQRQLLRRFFAWVGPASMAEFQWFSGWSAKVCKAAAHGLKAVEGERWVLEEDWDSLQSFRVPGEPQVVLVGSLDPIHANQRNLRSIADEGDLPPRAHNLSDLDHHAILDRGKLIGLWDFDVEKEEIVYKLLVAEFAEIRSAVEKTQDYIRRDLGDARQFSLDSPKGRSSRLAALKG